METLIPQRKRLAGFSLVEMAIVILIAGIMMGAGLSLLSVKQDAAKRDVTQKNQESIKQALITYLGKYKRLPCPAVAATPVTGAEARGGSPCTHYAGIVPYQELGLDRATALDGWENLITYVVSPSPITLTLPATIPPAPIWTTAWLYSYSTTPSAAPCSTTTCSNNPTPPTGPIPANPAFWSSTSTGGITVTDGTTTIANPVTATGAAVVLISYGKNGYGAFNVKGKNAPPPSINADELLNTTISDTGPSIVKRDTTETFDDIVMMLSANDLTGPLIANGTLQSSAQAALSQANDIVLGNIVALKSLPTCTAIGCATGVGPFPTCDTFQYTCTSSYTIPPSPPNPLSPTFSANVTAWGITYQRGAYPDVNISTASGVAYTLTAGDGATKPVSIGELQGILTRGAGFN